MALITQEQRRAANLIIPFGLAGFVLYKGYASKGKTDWVGSGIMALIILVCAYVVITQTTKMLSNAENTTA